jgi:hypothetical protein
MVGTRQVGTWIATLLFILWGLGLVTGMTSADASGGISIASAPQVRFGALETGGGTEDEFWRIPLFGGDRITIDATIPDDTMQFNLFSPSVSDFTIQSTSPVAAGTFYVNNESGDVQTVLRSPFTGLGTLAVCDRNGGDCSEIHRFKAEAFSFTATVAHATHMTLSAPPLVRRRQSLLVVGHLQSPAGTPEGSCLLDGHVAPVVRGECRTRIRAVKTPRQLISGQFVPADGWQPAAARRAVRVVRR